MSARLSLSKQFSFVHLLEEVVREIEKEVEKAGVDDDVLLRSPAADQWQRAANDGGNLVYIISTPGGVNVPPTRTHKMRTNVSLQCKASNRCHRETLIPSPCIVEWMCRLFQAANLGSGLPSGKHRTQLKAYETQ